MAVNLVEVVVQGPQGPVGPQGGGTSFVVNLLSDLPSIPNAVLGDLAYVIADPTDGNNGQYVATVTPPVVVADWTRTQQDVSWGNLVGNLSDQSDLEARFQSAEADITKLDTRTLLVAEASGVDVDTLVVSGAHSITLGVNMPGGDGTGKLYVIKDSLSVLTLQRVDEVDDGRTYTRFSVSGLGNDWSPWLVINQDATLTGLVSQLRFTLDNFADVDTLILEGKYLVATNLPESGNGDLTVIGQNGSAVRYQQLLMTSSGVKYSRSSASGVGNDWTAWVETIESARVESFSNFNVSLGVDTDTLVDVGLYEIDNTIPGTLPVGIGSVLQLVVRRFNDGGSPNRVTQAVEDLADGKIYDRAAADYSAPVWTAWVERDQLANTSEVLTLKDLSANEPVNSPGQLFYANGSLNFQDGYSDVTLQVGKELYIEVINNTGVAITNGSACRHNGVSGGIVQVALALADTFSNARVLGVATHDIPNGQQGIITTYGSVGGLNTTGINPGVPLYLSDTVAGTYSDTVPSIITQVGGALTQDATDGRVFISIDNNVILPSAIGSLQGQVNGTYSLTANVPAPIIGYSSEIDFYTVPDLALGNMITTYSGIYEISITVGGTITDEEIDMTFDLMNDSLGVVQKTFKFTSGRGSNPSLVPFSNTMTTVLDVLAPNTTHSLRITSAANETVVISQISFTLKSLRLNLA